MISISFDETHHTKNGKPLYDKRFDRVMSFHENIAPIELKNRAFFINKKAEKLFNRDFQKAYGFYENKSAVKDEKGWFHIDTDGNDIYQNRYAWVGNFNEDRCVVKDFNNNYFHIDKKGNRVYKQNYTYTGDYKYGIAVVMNDDGKFTHIDNFGNLIHGKYFDDLNIFHKGFAIAKDNRGYFHINKKGEALYPQRYKKIEDFYNGSAFATTFDDKKVILQESDLEEIDLTQQIINKEKILNENFSYFKYQILFSILKLDILNKLQNNQNIKLPNISKKLIFRWLYVEKLIDENKKLTKLGEVIENELKDIILYWQDLPFKSSTYMTQTLLSGNESFSTIFHKKYFNFLEDNKSYLELSTKINTFYTIDYTSLIKFLHLSNETVCDIGGGDGKLLQEIKNIYPNIKPIIADKFIKQKNKLYKKIDFFQEFHLDGDIFLLSRVLHDWNDKEALIILKNISKNMTSNTILYIFETIVPKNPKYDKGITLSFHLLNFLGGYERNLEDFEKLLTQANLRIEKVFQKDELISLIKVVKE